MIVALVTISMLNHVTREVNRDISYQTDLAHYGVRDKWVTEPIDHKGDCEDYALTKMARLQAQGVPAGDMHIDIVDTRQGAHAVLWVSIEGHAFVLDNLNNMAVRVERSDYYKHTVVTAHDLPTR